MKKLAKKSARAEIREIPTGKNRGFEIRWVGKMGAFSSGYLHRTKELAIEIATLCGASSVRDCGTLALVE